jgi:hypothetical protein
MFGKLKKYIESVIALLQGLSPLLIAMASDAVAVKRLLSFVVDGLPSQTTDEPKSIKAFVKHWDVLINEVKLCKKIITST